jgi:hypothetical protein
MAKLPSAYELRDMHMLLNMTYEDIARQYGASKQAVQIKLATIGYAPQGRDRYKLIPWELSSEHTKQRRAQLLRAHMRDVDGQEATGKLGSELPGFRRRLRTKVLDYSPEDGLIFVDRTPKDGDLIIRWPEDLELPAEGLIHLFKLPLEMQE